MRIRLRLVLPLFVLGALLFLAPYVLDLKSGKSAGACVNRRRVLWMIKIDQIVICVHIFYINMYCHELFKGRSYVQLFCKYINENGILMSKRIKSLHNTETFYKIRQNM